MKQRKFKRYTLWNDALTFLESCSFPIKMWMIKLVDFEKLSAFSLKFTVSFYSVAYALLVMSFKQMSQKTLS